jgi:hypothetical protein
MNWSSQRYKYPRTPHLPWSRGTSTDDVHVEHCAAFEGQEVVVTEKMDGENTSLYREGMHARSLDSRHHASRDWVKAWHGSVAHEIPAGWRFCGENLFARHSVAYSGLRSYFYLFSVWDAENNCLSWPETVEWAELLGCAPPKVLYAGLWNATAIKKLRVDESVSEGYVVRLAKGFAYADFSKSVAKWVRRNHVQTDQHWMYAQIVPNQLATDE